MRFYHGETAKRNALQGKHLRAFEYLDTTRVPETPPSLLDGEREPLIMGSETPFLRLRA